MSMLSNREGFALPMSILVIGFLTAGVVASFARVGTEVQSVDNARATSAAFAAAEAGMAQFLASGVTLAPGQTEVTAEYIVLNGDSARVTARLLRQEGNRRIVVISSEGIVPGSGPGRPAASRTVAQFGIMEPVQMQVLAAWTSLSGVRKNGNSGWFAGEDQASPSCGNGVTRAGIALPSGMAEGNHIHNRASGEPPVDERGTPQQMAAEIEIDWIGITDPVSPTVTAGGRHLFNGAGYVVCKPSSYGHIADYNNGQCGGMPTNYDSWPTVVVNGSASGSDLPKDGQGLLIVTGDLTLNGNQNWDGVILVGGTVTDNGQGLISGSVITGLNVMKGENVSKSEIDISVANGTKRYQYDSCAIESAIQGAAGGPRLISSTWVDNWATW